MTAPNIRPHPHRDDVLAVLTAALESGQDTPSALLAAARALQAANPGMAYNAAFEIVWNLWSV